MDQEILLTKAGHERLRAELDHLVKVRRREIARRLKEATAFGDLSENAEYEDAKNEQSFVEGRVKALTHILKYGKVIDEKSLKVDEVRIGITVVLREAESGKKREFKIVHPVEADPDLAQISYESPVGQALLGAKKGDVVEVNVPHGALSYRVEEIRK